MTSILNPGNPPVAPGLPTPDATRLTRRQSPSAMPGMQAFGAQNNLIGQQINPTNSGFTQGMQDKAQGAGDAYNTFQFGQFQGLQPMNFGAERGMLGGANTAMQGLGYNFGAANQQYGAANQQYGAGQSALAGAAGQSGAALQGLQGLGIGAFSGGGANLADFGAADKWNDTAMSTVSGALSGLNKDFQYAGDTMKARGFVVPALERAMNAPDRNALAAESLALMEERSRRGFDDTMRTTADQQAAMGRRGSGMTAKALNDVTNRREQELAWARRDLANEASGLTMRDNVDRTNLALGVTQGLGSEDRSAESLRQGAAGLQLQGASTQLAGSSQRANNAQFNASQSEAASQRAARGAQFGADFQRGVAGDLYGMGRDLYGMGRDQANFAMGIGDRFSDQDMARVGLGERQANFSRNIANDLGNYTRDTWNSQQSERDAARQDEYDQNNVRRTRFSDFLGATRDGWNQDRSTRNELRGERDYQYGLSRDAVDDEYRRMNFEESLRGNRYGRGQGYLNSGGDGAGLAGAYGAAGAQQGANAADSYAAFANLMAMLGRGQRRGGGGSGTQGG
jgi:hypothetical protein